MEGTILNQRYELTAQAGQGGMGTVYRAYDKMLERQVAVKVLHATGLDSAGEAKLLGEARAAAQLDHPNIVTVHDVGQADGIPFLVMQWVDGVTLEAFPTATLAETIALAGQICAALEHAHSQGIIHRDLKPENVLVSPEGTARLMDFGLARSISRLSVEDGLVGTVAYMAPEQALGQPVDGRADLYSLGVMLYEMVTGGAPFQADDPFALITQHLHAPVVPPRAKNDAIPANLNQLILALLAKQPAERPENAAEVAAQLGAIAQTLDLAGETAPPAARDVPTTTPTALLERIVRGQLVGRKTELGLLRDSWRKAQYGTGQLVLLSGEPGIGKTRLAQELATQVQVQGGKALTGASYPDQPVPFGPFAQIVLPVFTLEKPDNLVNDFTLAELIRLAPPLQGQFPHIPPNPELEPQAARYRMFSALVTLCRALAAQAPVLWVLEDLHWADEGTLALLLHLARAIRELPVLMMATYRETDLGENLPLQDALRELERTRLGQRVKLGRLDQADTKALLERLFGQAITPDFLAGIYRETEGVPFFVEEVCKTLVESGQVYYADGRWRRPDDIAELAIPQSVQVALQRRLARLDSATVEILTVGGILGRSFDYELLIAVTGAGEDKAIAALEAAETAQLIREESGVHGGTFAFTHALIPGTLVEGLSGLRRRRWHLKAAEALVRLRPQEPARIAHHYWLAENPAGVLHLQQAGNQAAAQYANHDAIRWYSWALELVQEKEYKHRFALLEGREKVYDLLGNREAQQEDLAQLAELAARLEPTTQIKVALRQGRYAINTKEYAQAIQHAQTAIEGARRVGDPGLAAAGYRNWGSALYLQGQGSVPTEFFQQGLQLAQEAGDKLQIGNCSIGLGNMASRQGDEDTAREYYMQALANFREIGAREREWAALGNLGHVSRRQREYEAARGYYQKALATSQEIGFRLGEAGSYMAFGDITWTQHKDPVATKSFYKQALAIYREVGSIFEEGYIFDHLGGIAMYQGDITAAQGHYEQALAYFQEKGNRSGIGWNTGNLGWVASDLRNYALAREQFEKSLEIFQEIDNKPGKGWALANLGAVVLALGDLTLAENCYQQALEIHQDMNQSQYLAEDWAGLARVKLAQGDSENARGYAEQTLDFLRENPHLQGADNPMQAFRYTWEVWAELDTGTAEEVLALAAAVIQDYLDQNPDPAAQELYLQMPHHAVLWSAWQHKQAHGTGDQ